MIFNINSNWLLASQEVEVFGRGGKLSLTMHEDRRRSPPSDGGVSHLNFIRIVSENGTLEVENGTLGWQVGTFTFKISERATQVRIRDL
ncbi:hypothetical protein PanWU01x14_053250 [Parasponia andersonii]|uniref:Uncharacterized protein n=1 Tax=Parasponia andersonii TaxID=3476 RepID=A0A2P5DLH4_PARAD|nr:hypothetical protein PanWU01x14_053250 [Parasponia andersonii]